MKVLVTGASGFVGGEACRVLLGRSHEVAALVRRPDSQPPGTRPLRGDLADGPGLEAAIRDAEPECVVHLAAEIATQRSARRIDEINVGGTRRLVDACVEARVRRIVFGSTVVTGDAHGSLLTEESALPVETAYGRSKQRCEQLLRAAPVESVVIRPSHVYGAGGWYAEDLVDRLRKPGRYAVVGRGDNWWDVVRVEDVAAALALGVESAPAGALYHVVDDGPITLRDFVALTARALGRGRPRSVPVALARVVTGRDPVLAVTRSARSSNELIKRELFWKPRFPTAAVGVPDAVAKLRGAADAGG